MRNRRTTQTRLVGEDPARHTKPNGSHYGSTGKATHRCVGVEGVVKDHAEGFTDLAGIDNQHHQPGENIKNAHDRHQLTGDLTDTLDTANDHRARQHHQNQARGPGRNTEGRTESISHGVGLHGITDPEGGDRTKESESTAQPQPLPAQAILDIEHGPAEWLTVALVFRLRYGSYGFGNLVGLATQAVDQLPNHGTGPPR